MTTLVDHEARQLFNQYAFKEEVPDGPFEELTLEVINYAKGLPLALKVWGSLLYNRDITEWRSAIADMSKNTNSKIVDKLIISYNRLEQTQQRMFLDLACFFRGEDRDQIKQVLESCDFEVDFGLCILIDRSLVFISHEDRIEMHDLIQEMGKHVVNMKREPGERSRLWLCEDIKEVLKNNTGTKAVEAIWVPSNADVYFSNEAFINMRSLRIFHLEGWRTQDGSIGCLPNSLRWFVWEGYPWESLPEAFEPEKLVHLQLTFCNHLRFLWTGIKDLRYLRMLNLGYSERLERTPDFTTMPNLKYLYLGYCYNLEEVSHSLGCCKKLIKLSFYGCSKLERLPEEIGDLENLEDLDVGWTAISQPPSSIVRLNNLKLLSFKKSHRSKVNFVFPPVGEGLRSLEYLDLTYCNLIDGGLPEDLGCLSSLESLDLCENSFEHLPQSIVQLGALRYLDLRWCNLDGGLPEDIGCLSSLEVLNLKGNKFEHLPRSIAQLGALRVLDLEDCHNLKALRELPPALDVLNAEWKKDSIYNSFAHALFQNLSSKQHDISASDSLSQRVFTIESYYKVTAKIPRWFQYQGRDITVLGNLPKDWYSLDNFLGFAVCYDGMLVDTTVALIPLCDDGEMPWMTQKFALHNYSKHDIWRPVHFFFVPLAGLWDTSKANGKTPNDYGHIQLYFSGEIKKYGLRLLYKDEPELESDDNDECEPESEDNDECEPESEDNDESGPESER